MRPTSSSSNLCHVGPDSSLACFRSSTCPSIASPRRPQISIYRSKGWERKKDKRQSHRLCSSSSHSSPFRLSHSLLPRHLQTDDNEGTERRSTRIMVSLWGQPGCFLSRLLAVLLLLTTGNDFTVAYDLDPGSPGTYSRCLARESSIGYGLSVTV